MQMEKRSAHMIHGPIRVKTRYYQAHLHLSSKNTNKKTFEIPTTELPAAKIVNLAGRPLKFTPAPSTVHRENALLAVLCLYNLYQIQREEEEWCISLRGMIL